MKKVFVALMALLCGLPAAAQESLRAEHIAIRWLAPEQFGRGREIIGLLFEMDPEWHVYWRNPGDSGAAPKFALSTSDPSSQIGPIMWPFPERIPVAHLTNIGYSRAVAYLFEFTPGAQKADVTVKLEWLVCKEECIPGFGTLTLRRPVAGGAAVWNANDKKARDQFAAKLPAAGADSPWRLSAAQTVDGSVRVKLAGAVDVAGVAATVYPFDGNFFNPAPPQTTMVEDGIEFLLQSVPGADAPEKSDFLVVVDGKAYEFLGVPLSAPAAEPITWPTFLLLIGSAFLGGLILNLMPCVLPVLSIKIMSLAKTADGARLREAGFYTLGVLVTFAALGAVFLIVRSAGAAIGWGFHLQSPVVVLSLVILFWMMALNFLGAFELGTGIMNFAGRFQQSSAFGTGILSVFVAAPCTGPFMGTALGAAATVSAPAALAIFLSLGLGLAAPFVVLAMSPKLMALLPKPGAWMDRLKQFFAFPLFGTVLWLLWILALQTGVNGWLAAGVVLFVISFCVWLARSPRKVFTAIAWGMAFASIGWGAFNVSRVESATQTASSENNWQPYDRDQILAAREAGRNVFVDFTAAWCITCQVNKKAVLETDAAQKLFQLNDVFLVRADWTQQNAEITKALAEFGRNSVPLYVFYPKDGSAPRVLPQILSLGIIEDLFGSQEEQK